MAEFVYYQERRAKAFYLSEEQVLEALLGRLRILNLPPSCRIDRAWPDFGNRRFGFVVEHPDFDPVAAGSRVPVIEHLDFEILTGTELFAVADRDDRQQIITHDLGVGEKIVRFREFL